MSKTNVNTKATEGPRPIIERIKSFLLTAMIFTLVGGYFGMNFQKAIAHDNTNNVVEAVKATLKTVPVTQAASPKR